MTCLSIKILTIILIISSVEVLANNFSKNLTANFYSGDDSEQIDNSFVVSIYQQNLLKTHSFVLHFPKYARYILVLRSTKFYGNSSDQSTCYPVKMGVYRTKHWNGDFIYFNPFIQYWFPRNARSTDFKLIPISNTSVFTMNYLHKDNCNSISAVTDFFGIVAYGAEDKNICAIGQNKIFVFFENKNHTLCVYQLDESLHHLLMSFSGIAIKDSTMLAVMSASIQLLSTSLNNSKTTSTNNSITTSANNSKTTSTNNSITTSTKNSKTTSTNNSITTSTNNSITTSTNNSITTSAPMVFIETGGNDKYFIISVVFMLLTLILSVIILWLCFDRHYLRSRLEELSAPEESSLCPKLEPRNDKRLFLPSNLINNRDSERGFCMIINIQHFSSKSAMNRDGSDIDQSRLKSTFERLRYNVMVYNDLTLIQIQSKMKLLAHIVRPDHDSVVICLLSHGGDQNFIYTSDNQQYHYRNCIMEDLGPRNCRALIMKPKIIIVQAGRGDLMDVNVMKNNTNVNNPLLPTQCDFLFCGELL